MTIKGIRQANLDDWFAKNIAGAQPPLGFELITGGQRLHLYGDYLKALARAGLPTEPFETYLETFRYGMPPHGGLRFEPLAAIKLLFT